MKIRIAIYLLAVAFMAVTSIAQSPAVEEIVIRHLEQRQVELLLDGDVKQMEAAWLPEFTVNNPFNDVVNGHSGPIRMRRLTYSAFSRKIEKIVFRGGIAIVMGSETVVPSGTSDDVGKEIRRRFTNIWVKSGGKWKMLARHANVVCGS
jgi:hypothetical protein